MAKLFKLLRQVEESSAPNDEIVHHYKYRYDVDGSLVTSYFVNRLKKDKVSSERVINFVTNLGENHVKFLTISGKLNEIIIWLYYTEDNKEYLYSLLNNDPRKIRPLIRDLISYLVSITIHECVSYIDDIANNTKYSVVELSLLVLKELQAYNVTDAYQVRFESLLLGMSEQTINDLLTETLRDSSFLFNRIKPQLSRISIFSYVQEHLSDDEGLCAAIQQTPTPISFMYYPPLRQCLFEKYYLIPKTIKHIFDSAVKEDDVYMLMDMGHVFNRKEILRALISSANRGGNRDIIDKFIVSYKKYEDIKAFTPFM